MMALLLQILMESITNKNTSLHYCLTLCNILKTCPSLPYTCTISRLEIQQDGWMEVLADDKMQKQEAHIPQLYQIKNKKPKPRTKNQNQEP